MLKPMLLAGSMLIAAPLAAQNSTPTAPQQSGRTPMTATTAPVDTAADAAAPQAQTAPTTSPAPTGDAITAQTSPATPAPTAPADPVVAQQPATPATPDAAAPAQSAAAQPAAGATQVAQIVGREFGAYDKDKDGKLSRPEFDAWMVALKTASDPATKAGDPATQKWLGAAFAQADADKNAGVSQTELTGFLSQGQS